MTEIQRRGFEWAVVHGGAIVSLHPSRAEADRAAQWLREREPAETVRDEASADRPV